MSRNLPCSPGVPSHHHSDLMADSPPILYCRCAYAQVVPNGVKNAVLESLAAGDHPFEAVSDLCEFAAHRDPRLAELRTRAETDGLRIVACYPRVVRGLFKQAGAELPPTGVSFHNMRAHSAEEIAAQLQAQDPASDPPP